MNVFDGKSPSWLAADDLPWTTHGFDPSIFPRGELPMKRKRVIDEHGQNEYSVALLGYALAHRAKRVKGPPRYLLSFDLSPEDVTDHSWEGSLKIYPETNTLAIKKKLNLTNFPGLRECMVHPITEQLGKHFLEIGYTYINA